MDRLPKTVSKLFGEQPVLKILIITVVLAIGLFLIYRATRTQGKEGFGVFLDEQSRFTRNNQDYYWNKFNRGLMFNDGLQNSIARLDMATGSVDTQYNTLTKPGLDKYFSVDPLPGLEARNQQCSNVTEPSMLPRHDSKATSGCGWWYVDEDNNASTGARGSEAGAFDTTLPNSYPGGVWIWDLDEAQKKEDVKRCRRIKMCDMIDTFAGKCGFCPAISASIPVVGSGMAKYPNDPSYNCTARTITDSNLCPKPAPTMITNAAGNPSLSTPPAICDLVNGRLTVACLIELASTIGLSGSGAIISILSGDAKGYTVANGGDNAYKYSLAIAMLLKHCNIASDPAFIGKGVCDKPTAMEYYTRVKNATTSFNPRCRDAAKFLAFGTDFDPCEYNSNERGPFDLYCLQRTFREAGCQPDGTMYPTVNNKAAVDELTWIDIRTFYEELRNNSNSDDYEVQADNARKCLGVTITPKRLDCGDVRGCEVLWYLWNFDYNFHINSATNQTFMGRQISPTLPNFNESDGSFNPYGRNSGICFRTRTNLINTDETTSATLSIMSDDGIAIKSRNQTIMKQWYNQGPTTYTSDPFVLANGAPTPLDVYWYTDSISATFIPKLSKPDGTYDFIPASMLQMSVPSGFPVCRWDFYMGTYNERCSVLSSNPTSLRMGTLGNKKCALFSDINAGVLISNPVRIGAIRTLTFMANISSTGQGVARLFSFRESKATCADNSDAASASIEGGVSQGGRLWLRMKPAGNTSEMFLQTPPDSFQLNQWTHLTYSISPTGTAAAIYVDGKIAGSQQVNMDADYYNQMIANDVKIGLGPQSAGCNKTAITGGIAWTHWFDYPFEAAQAAQDMTMEFTKSTVYREDRASGWVAKF